MGWFAARAAGVSATGAATALSLAWLVQVAAFTLLVRRLRRGGDATRAWVIGITGRAGALMGAWVVAAVGLASRPAAAVFGLGLTTLLILEAVWLATSGGNAGPNEARRE